MLSVQPPSKSSPPTSELHLLPCRIRHDGPADASEKHWMVDSDPNSGTKTVHFRGRKLLGRELALPEGYCGCILQTTDEVVKPKDGEEEEGAPETKKVNQIAHFNAVTVWGHEELVDERENNVMRGVNEWLSFAEKIHGFEMDEGEGPENGKTAS